MSAKPSTSAVTTLLKKAIDFFDVTVLSKIDLSVEGNKTVYVDPLGNKTQPMPTDMGHNLYYIHSPDDKFRQEICFQSGSPSQGVNGLSNEAVISVVLHRLSKQNETFPSPYNVLAIYMLQGALAALHSRVKDRKEFGIWDTVQVEPSDIKESTVSRALALVNSIGLLANVVFKFDSAYGLQETGKVHKQLDILMEQIPKEADATETNIASAFSFISTVVMGSGIVRSFASIAHQFSQVQKLIMSEDNEGQSTSAAPDASANAESTEEAGKDNPAHHSV